MSVGTLYVHFKHNSICLWERIWHYPRLFGAVVKASSLLAVLLQQFKFFVIMLHLVWSIIILRNVILWNVILWNVILWNVIL